MNWEEGGESQMTPTFLAWWLLGLVTGENWEREDLGRNEESLF